MIQRRGHNGRKTIRGSLLLNEVGMPTARLTDLLSELNAKSEMMAKATKSTLSKDADLSSDQARWSCQPPKTKFSKAMCRRKLKKRQR